MELVPTIWTKVINLKALARPSPQGGQGLAGPACQWSHHSVPWQSMHMSCVHVFRLSFEHSSEVKRLRGSPCNMPCFATSCVARSVRTRLLVEGACHGVAGGEVAGHARLHKPRLAWSGRLWLGLPQHCAGRLPPCPQGLPFFALWHVLPHVERCCHFMTTYSNCCTKCYFCLAGEQA